MALTDCLGNAVTLQDSSSLAAVNDFAEGFIACEARVLNVLPVAARDHCAIVQAYAAALQMFAETPDAPAKAKPFIDRALAASASGHATAREARFATSIAAWVNGDIDQALALHLEQAAEFPRDLASVKLGQYHAFNRGDMKTMLRLALLASQGPGGAADVPYLHGMLAFGWEQCQQLADAEREARLGMAMCHKEPWAHHALAHVMLTQHRHREGQAFMLDASPTWTGLNSFMLSHNWWHQALFALELGEFDEALRLYDERVWGVAKDYSQDQANAVSLLSRLELQGVDVGDRWQDIANYLAPRTHDQVSPFLDLHYLYGLTRAERPEADMLMRQIEQKAAATAARTPVWAEAALPAARALQAFLRGEPARASALFSLALPALTGIGGSHAQRAWFDEIAKHARHA